MFCGQPYVDVRASFNSFIPADIPEQLAGRLVDFYLRSLAKNPKAHDKVEFEIVPTCYDLDFERWQIALSQASFSDEEIMIYKDDLVFEDSVDDVIMTSSLLTILAAFQFFHQHNNLPLSFRLT